MSLLLLCEHIHRSLSQVLDAIYEHIDKASPKVPGVRVPKKLCSTRKPFREHVWNIKPCVWYMDTLGSCRGASSRTATATQRRAAESLDTGPLRIRL